MGGYGQADMYSAQAQIARNNAILAQRNANVTMGEGEVATSQQQLKNRATIGAITAGEAASGVDVNTGSALDTRASAAEVGQLDALTIRSDYARRAYGFRTQAQQDREQAAIYGAAAQQSILGGYLSGLGTLDQTGGQMAQFL